MASITSLGIGSGLDLNGLLNQMDSAERLQLQPLSAQKEANQSKISAFGRLKSTLASLQTATQKLGDAKSFQGLTTKLSGTGVLAVASASAVAGDYSVEVSKLAKAQSLATSGVADKTAALGVGTLTITQGASAPVQVDIVNGANSLEGIRDAINAKGAGFSATIVSDGSATPHRLVLTSKTTGEQSEMTVEYSGTGSLSTMLGYDSTTHTGVMSQVAAAQNAELKVNGIAITSQTNTVVDAAQGVTLTLTETGGPQTMTVSTDTAAIKTAVSAFVDAYNALDTLIDGQTAYNEDSSLSGPLLGDSTLRSIKNRLLTAMNTPVAAAGGAYDALADIGISLQEDGKLKLDSTRLDSVLANDLPKLKEFFVGATAGTGFASQLDDALDVVLDPIDGLLKGRTDGLASANKRLDGRIASMERNIEMTVERYRKQFAALDSLLAQMTSTSAYLSQQFEAMNKQNS